MMKNFAYLIAVLLLGVLPVCAVVNVTGVSSVDSGDQAILGSVSNIDLGAGAVVVGGDGVFGQASKLNDGMITPGNGNGSAIYLSNTFSGGKLPQSYVFALDLTNHPGGYEVGSIQSFAGWPQNGPQLGNQRYRLAFSKVTDPTNFVVHGVYEYTPFNNNLSTGGSVTRMTVADDQGAALATSVHSVRVEFLDHGYSGPDVSVDGSVYYEVDIFAKSGSIAGADLTISLPKSRQLVQRNLQNTGDIEVSGTYLGSPDSVEARAVVMAGVDDSGVSSDWQVLEMSAGADGGSYSGKLSNIIAGGWYQIEVRSVADGVAGNAVVREKVGVGDIYVTAGQSNSANHGGPRYTPASDRVVTLDNLAGRSWRHAYDPQPLATGGGGSVWSRLGDELVAEQNIPIGFVVVGVGSSKLSSWLPATSNYISQLKPAVLAFPENGFRACLWHQGESDSIGNVSATTHASQLATMIAQSRADAGWDVPWYISEASFHPATNLGQEEPVTAGQRLAIGNDVKVRIGPRTNRFHLENAAQGKLIDGVHFNAVGLADFADQWKDILLGSASEGLINGDFESNTTPGLTTTNPLADGNKHTVSVSANTSPAVIGWSFLKANGVSAADGEYGYYNPSTAHYPEAADSQNNGVMAGMDGKHVVSMNAGSIGNMMHQTTRAYLRPQQNYELSVALGVRQSADVFAGAKLEVLADNVVVASETVTRMGLNSLAGGSALGKFTVAKVSYTTGENVGNGRLISCRISKVAASGYLDVDNAILVRTGPSNKTGLGEWMNDNFGGSNAGNGGLDEDPDQDGKSNLHEYAFGSDPNTAGESISPIVFDGQKITSTRRIGSRSGLAYVLEESGTLQSDSWLPVKDITMNRESTIGEMEVVSFTKPAGDWGSSKERFFRLRVENLNP